VSLEKLTAAVGTDTCQHCYSHTCHGPGNCDPNDISPHLPEEEARFINSGLYDLTLQMKSGASSGLQRNETPLQSTAFVTDTRSLQGHGAYGGHYYNGGHGGYEQPYAQEGGYDSYGAYHVQASQSHPYDPYDYQQASAYGDWNQNQPCQIDLNGHRSYERPWSAPDPYNYDRVNDHNQSWNYDREQEEQEQNSSQSENVLMAEGQYDAENQQSGEWPDPGAQAEDREEQMPPLSCNSSDSDSDSDSESDNEFSPRHDSSNSSE